MSNFFAAVLALALLVSAALWHMFWAGVGTLVVLWIADAVSRWLFDVPALAFFGLL